MTQVIVQGLKRHLRLHLKTPGHNRHLPDKVTVESSVPGHNVLQLALKDQVDQADDQFVPEHMKGSEGSLPEFLKPVAYNHVRSLIDNGPQQFVNLLRRVGVVSINQNVQIRRPHPQTWKRPQSLSLDASREQL